MSETETPEEPGRAWDTLKLRMRELDEVNARGARLLQERAGANKDASPAE